MSHGPRRADAGWGTGYNYGAVEGGCPNIVAAQVLGPGHSVNDYSVSSANEQAMITGITNHEAVTIDTTSSSNSSDTLPYGLYGCHAYAAVGYNASTQLFTLYNPWGCDQPNLLTWAQTRTDLCRFRRVQSLGLEFP